MESVTLEYRALPHAGINPEGDCGPACLAAIMGKTVQDVYDLMPGGDMPGVDNLCYRNAVKLLQREHIYFENFLPMNSYTDEDPAWFTFGRPGWFNHIEWFELAKRRMRGGLVGLSMINMHGKGHIEGVADHWVLIYGYRQENSNADSKILLVSCPTKGTYEMAAHTFLKFHGGYNTIWCQ